MGELGVDVGIREPGRCARSDWELLICGGESRPWPPSESPLTEQVQAIWPVVGVEDSGELDMTGSLNY